MIEGIPKISVLVICYKQEELIKRAINSLLAQKDYIYEICVSDDCSPDRTWEVLQEYDRQYPELFKLHRNEPNVGIFENIEQTWTMPTGDIVYSLAGDDECGEGWFKTVIEYIQKNDIDYKNELFCIYGDYKAVYPNGDYFVASNSLVSKYPDMTLSMSLRGAIASRSACYSIKILKNYKKVSQGRSYIAEDAQDRQLQMFTKKAYYIPRVGNIYYARIGVCVTMNKSEHDGRVDIFRYSRDFIERNNMLSEKESNYLLFRDALLHYNLKKSVKGLFRVWLYQHKGLIIKFDLNWARIQRIIYAVRRHLPHKKQIIKRIG